MYNFPSHKLIVQKRGSQPVCSASHTHTDFHITKSHRHFSPPFNDRGSRGEMEHASNNSFRGVESLKDVLSMKQPPGTTSKAGLSPSCWLPSSSSRDSCHPVTQGQHSPAAGHAGSRHGDRCFPTAWQPPPATSGTDLGSALSPALSPTCGTGKTLKPQERGELPQQSQNEEDADTFQGLLSATVPVRRCDHKEVEQPQPNVPSGPEAPVSSWDAGMYKGCSKPLTCNQRAHC